MSKSDSPFDDAPAPVDKPSKVFLAAFNGSCAECGGFISEGDEIRMTDDGAVHANIPECGAEFVDSVYTHGEPY